MVAMGVWCGYCSVNSFNPVALGMAIMRSPSGAQKIVAGAKTAAKESTSASNPLSKSAFQSDVTKSPELATDTSQTYGNVSVRDEQLYAFNLLATKYGDSSPQQDAALAELWNHESGWNPNIVNRSSGAYGIPQSLPASKMGQVALTGPEPEKYQAQIQWGLNYIQSRYGSPEAAWAFETSHTPNWY